MKTKEAQLRKRLAKIESELDRCRTSVMQDGWQTQRFAKKSRKWDILAQRKMQILRELNAIDLDVTCFTLNGDLKNSQPKYARQPILRKASC